MKLLSVLFLLGLYRKQTPAETWPFFKSSPGKCTNHTAKLKLLRESHLLQFLTKHYKKTKCCLKH